MATEPNIVEQANAEQETIELQQDDLGRQRLANARLADYWAVTKPEVNLLIIITTFAGFWLASSSRFHHFPFMLLIHTLLGTLLVASGAGTLNQYLERKFDAQMRRTARRPVASGRLDSSTALRFGILLSVMGCAYLALAVNALASMIAFLTLTSYLFIYTPLKRKTPLCTLVGVFPGAAPPLIGCAAASGRLGSEAWVLYSILFLWQFPHFMAIAWMYREDYVRAGYLVLPLGEERGRWMVWQSILPLLALVPLTVMPMLLMHDRLPYVVGVFILSSVFLLFGARLVLQRSNMEARRLLFVSIMYLPFVFLLMTLARS
jgi:protoheme IX farnesyltransferase